MLSRRDFLKATLVGAHLPLLSAAGTLHTTPWVQNLCRGGASILWKSYSAGTGVVEYSQDRSFSSRVVAQSREFPARETGLPNRYYLYRADLGNLAPAGDYYYRVLADGSLLTPGEGIRIRTGGAASFDFLVFGDCGLGTSEQSYLAQRMLGENAALALITGDLVYMSGSYPEYEERFFPYYGEMMRRVPIFPSPGNHDYGTQNLAPYLATHALPVEMIPPEEQGRYYSFDWGNVHFVSIDTNESFMEAISGGGRMLEWLESDLARTDRFWRVAYFHHPPYSWGIHTADPVVAMVRERIAPILDRHRVDVVFCGHEHSYSRSQLVRGGKFVEQPPGTTYVITGGGGANLYPVIHDVGLARGESAHHYVRVENRGPLMRTTAVRIDGQVIDTFTLAPPPTICSAFLSPKDSGRILEWDRPVAAVYGRHLAAETRQATELPLPRTLAGTRVTFYGRPLPLLSVSDTKIEAQVPYLRQWARLRVETPNGSAETDVVFTERPAGSVCI